MYSDSENYDWAGNLVVHQLKQDENGELHPVPIDNVIEKIKKDFDNDKSSLTKREREIALLAQRGITTKEISKRLFISTETVKMTLKKVYRKLDVHSKAELNTVKF